MLLLALTLTLASPTHQPPVCTLPDGVTINLELAVTPDERSTGLMFRERLEDNWGMLFVFENEGFWPFWMKNTLIPLDMAWLDRDGQVVELMTNVEPCRLDPCPSYTPTATGRAVLELSAGSAARHGVKVGTRIRFTGVSGYPVPPSTPTPLPPGQRTR